MVNVTMLNHGDFLKRPIFLDANQNASADNSSPFYDVTAISFLTLDSPAIQTKSLAPTAQHTKTIKST